MNLDNKVIAFHTLGCKVNQYETESLKQQFTDAGCLISNFDEKADFYVINSCTVTSIADRKTRNMIRRAKKKNPEAVVIATGCYAQTNGEDLANLDEIDYVVGNTDKKAIFNLVSSLDAKQYSRTMIKDIFSESKYTEYEFSTLREMTRAYIKIQDGCNNFCSYCKIPFARGKKRSRDIRNIMMEVEKLVSEGYKEIILIGINLGAYGEDLSVDTSLDDVVEKISKFEGVERVRLGSIYPDKISDKFIQLLANNEKIMPHLHISLQSGDDKILKLMNRKYDAKLAEEVLLKVKGEVKNIEFTADIIVGFPGETNEEFQNTYNLINKIGFSDLHIFQYSDREKTVASTLENKVSPHIKKERADKLEKLGKKLYNVSRERYLESELKVLVEEIKDNAAYGYTENYLRVKIQDYDKKENTIDKVKISKLSKGLLLGEIERD